MEKTSLGLVAGLPYDGGLIEKVFRFDSLKALHRLAARGRADRQELPCSKQV